MQFGFYKYIIVKHIATRRIDGKISILNQNAKNQIEFHNENAK